VFAFSAPCGIIEHGRKCGRYEEDEMKVAVIGSRSLKVTNLEDYLPSNTTEIVSGGAIGIDRCAEEYAKQHGIPTKIFLPDYNQFGKGAPLKRNVEIIEYADAVIAFWDGVSRGTRFVIDESKKKNKPVRVFVSK